MATRRNPVEAAIEKLGGIYAACHAADVTPATMYEWKRLGCVRLLRPAWLLSKATGIPLDDFVPPAEKKKR